MALDKLRKAAKQTNIKQIAIAGGVAANTGLRNKLTQLAKQEGWSIFIPSLAYCTDNAAMVAMAAYYQYLANNFCNLRVSPMPRMPL